MDFPLLNSTDPWETTGLTRATTRNSIMSQGSAMITDPRYFPEVVQVIPTAEYHVPAYFDDGSIHEFDAQPLLEKGVFAPLQDEERFRATITVMNGTLAWDLHGNRDETACLDVDPLLIYRESPEVEEPSWVERKSRPVAERPEM